MWPMLPCLSLAATTLSKLQKPRRSKLHSRFPSRCLLACSSSCVLTRLYLSALILVRSIPPRISLPMRRFSSSSAAVHRAMPTLISPTWRALSAPTPCPPSSEAHATASSFHRILTTTLKITFTVQKKSCQPRSRSLNSSSRASIILGPPPPPPPPAFPAEMAFCFSHALPFSILHRCLENLSALNAMAEAGAAAPCYFDARAAE
jgi:hypothetical protein